MYIEEKEIKEWTYNGERSRWKGKIASFLQDIACSHFMLLWVSNVEAIRYRKMFFWETFNDENDALGIAFKV